MMRRLAIVPVAVAVALFAQAAAASAHPLGNLTINHYAGLVVRPDALVIDYVIDYAEIPTLQLRSTIEGRVAEHCAAMARGLEVQADGARSTVRIAAQAVAFAAGQGGLDTMRLECQYRTDLPAGGGAHTLTLADVNYAERIGWREITARGDGTALETKLPAESISERLTAYPQDLFSSPPDVRTAEIRFSAAGAASPDEPAFDALPAIVARPADALASLITRADLGPVGFLLAVAVATSLGALHALSPGHGKTVMAAYLVGSRGSFRQAGVLALAVAVSHTAGVLALGALTLAGTAFIAPDRVYPYLSVLSAVIVLGLGVWLVGARVRHRLAHTHGHSHTHGAQGGAQPLGWRALAALGLAGGIIPSASALLVLLGAINLHRVELGLVLIVAFGFGMAFTLVGVGMALVGAGRVSQRRLASNVALSRAYAYVPTMAAVVVLLLGIVMSAQSVGALLRI